MTLDAFLVGKALEGIDVLPDQRLLNVLVDGQSLYGVVVEDVPENVPLTRYAPVSLNGTTLTADGMVFDTTQYEML